MVREQLTQEQFEALHLALDKTRGKAVKVDKSTLSALLHDYSLSLKEPTE